jgi:hypothetical protein
MMQEFHGEWLNTGNYGRVRRLVKEISGLMKPLQPLAMLRCVRKTTAEVIAVQHRWVSLSCGAMSTMQGARLEYALIH